MSGTGPCLLRPQTPNLVGDSAAQFMPSKPGSRFQGAWFALLVSADSVAIVLYSGSGFRCIRGGAGWANDWRRNRTRRDGNESGRRVDLGTVGGTRRGRLRLNSRTS